MLPDRQTISLTRIQLNKRCTVLGHATDSLIEACVRVKHLGYEVSKRIRIYGEEFEVISDPFPHESGVAIHVRGRKDAQVRILRLPATLVQAARESRRFAKAA